MEILFVLVVLALVGLFIVAGIRVLVALLRRNPANQAELTVTFETRPARPARSGNRRAPKRNTQDWPALLDRDDVLVVDTETTGLGKTAEVVAVGIVDTTGKVRLHVLSMPQSRMPREASDVHGLTRAVLRKRDAQPWPEVHAAVVEVLTAADVVLAWNAPFDERLLRQTAERHGLAFPDLQWRCVMRDYGGKALVVAAVDVGLTVSAAHGALTDVEMARRKGTFWQREKGPLCRVVVATWPDGAERREATSRRVPINAFSSVERGPSGSVGRP